MSAQDMTTARCKATCETEVFVNCYYDDQAKGWPTMRPAKVERPHSIELCALRLWTELNVPEK